MTRFYKAAEAIPTDAGWDVRLDGRPVKTPGRTALAVPGEALARAIAQEWQDQGETIVPTSLPLTGFANAAIDQVLPDVGTFRGQIAAYAASDLLCYRADDPAELIDRQAAAWDPLLAWAQDRYGVRFVVTSGIMPVEQPAATLAGLRGAVEAIDPWLLPGAIVLTQVGGSLVGALAVLEGQITAEALFDVASLDELWQVEQWGEDYEAAERLAARRVDFLRAADYCTLVRQG